MNLRPQPYIRPPDEQSESLIHDLEALLRSRTPLIVVETQEEPRVVALVRALGERLRLKALRWTITEGLRSFQPTEQPQESVQKPAEVLAYIKTSAQHSLFILLDFHPFLDEPAQVRHLKDIALSYNTHWNTVLLVSPQLTVPKELAAHTARFALPLPTDDELRRIVYDEAGRWGGEQGGKVVESSQSTLDLLVHNLSGLTATDARRLVRNALRDDGVLSPCDLPEVLRAKHELLGGDGLLTFEYDTAKFADVGGLARLRRWLEIRRAFFQGEPNPRLDPPRGVLLLGVQGCGKSLAARATAGVFGVPLLRLDFGLLYNKYYGETERNLRSALNTAEVLSPCVLWIDEMEKGAAVGDQDGGLSHRVLGMLLTWMSERKKPVFLVATANDITRLPPELVRKGRFDEIFFVDLPGSEVRRDIFKIHLGKRGLKAEGFDVESLAAGSDGFSGSEIEQSIVSALYAATAEARDIEQRDLVTELEQTRPLSVVMGEQVAALRLWAAGRTVPAD
jgi:SpoVK/Ycf46/Vps4 family AAA+-type ATPase